MCSYKLKPCPFYGGEAHIKHNESPYTLGIIVCNTCKAMVCFPWFKSETNVDLKENRRLARSIGKRQL